MICVKRKNQKMGIVILFLLFVIMLLLLSTAPCNAATGKARFDRFRGGSFDKFKSSKFFHGGGFQGINSANNKQGDQVFGADKRKVYTGPNPLHNR